MPKTKQTRSPNQQQQWATVRLLRNENTSEGSASIPTETKKAPKSKSSQRKDRINVLLDDLTAANTRLRSVHQELTTSQYEAQLAQHSLIQAQDKILSMNMPLEVLETRLEDEIAAQEEVQASLQYERRKLDRAKATSSKLRDELQIVKIQLPCLECRTLAAESGLEDIRSSTSLIIHDLKSQVASRDIEITHLKQQLLVSKRKMRSIQKRYDRKKKDSRSLHAIAKAKHAEAVKSRSFHLRRKGVIRREVREMTRILVKAGCGQEHVARIIRQLGASMGITVVGSMSRRSVGRTILEGGVMAELQLGYELKHASSKPFYSYPIYKTAWSFSTGFTLSSDGTSDKHINYESRHIAYKNPHTTSETSSHVIRMLDVSSSVDHTSETQVEGWKENLTGLVELYNSSPLAR